MKSFIIKPNEANQRFDKYLKKLLPNASTSFLYKMLRKKNITLNNKKAEGKESLSVGDEIKLFFSDETFLKFTVNLEDLKKEYEHLKALPMKGLKVVYEDEHILAVNKPANMLSQKASDSDLSANEYLLGYLIKSGNLDFETFTTFRPSVCNRLDRNTTGLLLMGKSLEGSQKLSMHLKERTIEKYYYALVEGQVKDSVHLKGHLVKDEATNKVTIYKEEQPDSVWIETAYRPLTIGKQVTLLEVHLITGKTHQIRAHLSSVGHPIIGDRKYGGTKFKNEVKHQLLHAQRVEFPDGRVISVEPPAVFEKIMKED